MNKKTTEISDKRSDFRYKEIYNHLRSKISLGEFPAGSRLPSADSLANTFSANRLTVRKAISHLIAEGLIYTKPAQGTYVVEDLDFVLKTLQKKSILNTSSVLNVGIVSKVIIADNVGFYHSDILAGIHKGLIENKANMTLLPFHHGESETVLFSHLSKSKFDAVVYLGPFDTTKLKTMIQNGPPSVIIDFSVKNSGTDCITIDNLNGAKMAIEYLIKLGHKKITIVSGPDEQPATKERLDGIFEAIKENNLNQGMIHIYKGDFSLQSGYNITKDILSKNEYPTAIFYMNDEMAHGGINAIKDFSSLNIPEDLSIIGFDNSAHAIMTTPQLTTINVPAMQMGKFAIQRLFAKMRNGGDYSTTMIQMDTKLVIRESTAPPKKAS
ncbi:MAG TPA: GntR family transcriptional regulator [Victivallales bacterium]|nr:GntR family transcriptional regulator [Victivallales bacterium]HRR28148.1 GntR family transcriptional regulator [Victivallales bacterium]